MSYIPTLHRPFKEGTDARALLFEEQDLFVADVIRSSLHASDLPLARTVPLPKGIDTYRFFFQAEMDSDPREYAHGERREGNTRTRQSVTCAIDAPLEDQQDISQHEIQESAWPEFRDSAEGLLRNIRKKLEKRWISSWAQAALTADNGILDGGNALHVDDESFAAAFPATEAGGELLVDKLQELATAFDNANAPREGRFILPTPDAFNVLLFSKRVSNRDWANESVGQQFKRMVRMVAGFAVIEPSTILDTMGDYSDTVSRYDFDLTVGGSNGKPAILAAWSDATRKPLCAVTRKDASSLGIFHIPENKIYQVQAEAWTGIDVLYPACAGGIFIRDED